MLLPALNKDLAVGLRHDVLIAYGAEAKKYLRALMHDYKYANINRQARNGVRKIDSRFLIYP
ncbi:hypothetical protein D3C84_1286910 [compost metagenome]